MADDEKTEVKPGSAETPVTPPTPEGSGAAPAEPDADVTPDAGADATSEPSADATSEPAPGDAPALTLAAAQGWKGFKLDDMGGATVGKLEGVYVDASSGEPEWLLARMGRFGHHCLIPARDAVGAAGHVWVPYSRDQIRKAPRMDPGKPLEQQAESTLLDHYGVASEAVGRGADLAKQDPSAVTARPA